MCSVDSVIEQRVSDVGPGGGVSHPSVPVPVPPSLTSCQANAHHPHHHHHHHHHPLPAPSDGPHFSCLSYAGHALHKFITTDLLTKLTQLLIIYQYYTILREEYTTHADMGLLILSPQILFYFLLLS